jgi:hypothetical protein
MTESEREGTAKDGDAPGSSLTENDGVDVSLIRWMLSLSHKQRLLVLQQNVNSILSLRNARRPS